MFGVLCFQIAPFALLIRLRIRYSLKSRLVCCRDPIDYLSGEACFLDRQKRLPHGLTCFLDFEADAKLFRPFGSAAMAVRISSVEHESKVSSGCVKDFTSIFPFEMVHDLNSITAAISMFCFGFSNFILNFNFFYIGDFMPCIVYI